MVKVESSDRTGKLGDRLKEHVLSRVQKVQANLDSGALRSLRVEVLPLGVLPRNPRSGKIKNLVDLRN